MVDKYDGLLAALARMDVGVRRDALRWVASRYPGALKECQRVEPGVYRRRAAHARAWVGRSVPRRAWLDAGHAAIVLWHDLHGLLGDLRVLRASAPWPDRRGALAPERRECWPEQLDAGRIDAPAAHAWLAAVVDWTPAQLAACLIPPPSVVAD